MSQLKAKCIDQVLIFENTPVITSGNINYDSIMFEFSSAWDGYTKTAIFYRSEDEVYYQLLDKANTCVIPKEVLTDKGDIYIGVFGVNGNTTLTSQVLKYKITKGAITENTIPADPTPDIYAQIISKYNHYDERLAYFENRFNGSVGDAEKLGGHTADYFATAEGLNAVQTTSKGSLTTKGWYRVAEYTSTSQSASGTQGNSCTLVIKNNNGNYHKIVLESSYGNQKFIAVESLAKTHTFTKIRYVKQDTVAYLEVYFDSSTKYSCAFTVSNGNDYYFNWKAITPILTEETVDGATVTTTYDIPANASPISDNDLSNGIYPLGAVGKDRFILYPDGGTFDSTEDLTGQIRITLPQSWGNSRISFKVGINDLTSKGYCEYIISGYMSTSSAKWTVANAVCNLENAYPVFFAHDGEKNVVCIGNTDTLWQKPKVQIIEVMVGHYSYRYATWSKGWTIAIVTDNSDLTVSATVENPYVFEKFNTGLKALNGTENLGTSLLEKAVSLTEFGVYKFKLGGTGYTGEDLPNSNYVYAEAEIIVRDSKNRTVILYPSYSSNSRKIVTNCYYNGQWSGWSVVATEADLGNALTTELAKYLPLTGGNIDSLTVANKTVHHDGNSAKLHIGPGAPSDTTSAWIDTSK